MKRILYLECNSGISGDMTVGALLDLGADRKVLEEALRSLKVDGYHLHFGRTVKSGIDAFDFDVHLEEDGEKKGHGHGEGGHGHGEDGHGCGHGHGEDGHGCGHGHGEDGHGHEHGEEGHGHHHGEDGHSHSHRHGEDGHGHHHGEDGHSHDHGEEGHRHDHGKDGHSHSHGEEDHDHHHDHHHGHHHSESTHHHRNLYDIYEIIDRMDSNERVKTLSKKMFHIVAEAEAKAHGLPVDQVHFHEVGAIDSIVDLISVAVCVDNLEVDEVVISPLAEGQGYVRCQHGTLPVPVPATANIAMAHGLELRLTDNNGEMVTPTGAAIAAALKTMDHLPESCKIRGIGLGAGKREYKQANILRAMILQTTEEPSDKMWVLESNLDDCTGENLGFAMECLLEGGAADVWYQPIFMKKNRPAYQLSVLCKEEEREKLESIIFSQTTTIGIRKFPVERSILPREIRTVNTSLGEAKVKICRHKTETYFYPEYETVRAICRETKKDFKTVYHQIQKEAQEQ